MSDLLSILVTSLAVVLLYIVAAKAVLFVTGAILYCHQQGYTAPYVAGAAVEFLAFLARERPSYQEATALITAAVTVTVAAGINELTGSVLSSASSRSGNPPPVLAPLKKSELEMPTDPPRRLPRAAAPWPPFTGVRVELGEQ